MEPKFSIRYKILGIITIILCTALGIVLYMATKTFQRDKTELIFDLTKNMVSTLSTEMETILNGTVDKLRMYTLVYTGGSSHDKKAFQNILETDPNMVHMELFATDNLNKPILLSGLSQKDFLTTYDLPKDFFAQLVRKRPIPFQKISETYSYVWNATIKNGPPLVGVAIAIVEKQGVTKHNKMAIGFVRGDLILKSIVGNVGTSTFVLDSSNKVLLHPDPEFMIKSYDYSNSPLTKKTRSGVAPTGVMIYQLYDKEYLGAYSRTSLGPLTVVSQMESVALFEAVYRLASRSFIIGIIILGFTIIVTILFSRSLIEPMRRLMKAMGEVADGNLDVQFNLQSKDEIGVLAQAFNQMTRDLRRYSRKLTEANRELENKVKLRTQELEERTKQLEEMAIKDPLTTLYNRRYFNERGRDEVRRAERYETSVSIIYLDIDHFKIYNDKNGHQKGDELLKLFSGILKSAVRTSDFCARLGGEEFCIVLPSTPIKGALETAEKIRKTVEQTEFFNGVSQPFGRVTCSLGVSEFPTYARDLENLVKSADEALYRVKNEGRNKVGLAIPPITKGVA